MAVKLLVDSASDYDAAEAEKEGITLIPIKVRFKDAEYLDGVNLSHSEFFEKLIESAELPKTSQINPFEFEKEFERLTSAGDEVVAVTLSSKLSGTYKNAKIAAKKYEGRVFVVDSLNASLGERLLCRFALRMIAEGRGAKEIYEELNSAKHRIKLLAVLGTLKYLKKGGRINAITAFTGDMLSIKPVVGVIDGEVKLVGKAMGSKKSNNLLNSLVQKEGIDFSMPYGVMRSGLDKAMLKKYIADSSGLWQGKTDGIPEYMIGSTIGTHIGPGAIGVAFFALPK